MKKVSSVALTVLALLSQAACEGGIGRPQGTESAVKLAGVGMIPDEIGPSATPYGGVVEYDHVDFGGAGIPLGLVGLGGTDAVGPNTLNFEPPYEAVFGFSYLFDMKMPGAATMAQIGSAPPEVVGTCYTAYSPSGSIGSFTTVDAGDYLEFSTGSEGLTADGAEGLRFSRFPTDYPPNAQNVVVYYIGFTYYRPFALTHLVPNEDYPDDPSAMVEEVYKTANYPFGQEVQFNFPGGFTNIEQKVSSIPHPAKSAGITALMLPERLGPVVMSWTGPHYDGTGAMIDSAGLHTRCFEFYEGRPDEESNLENCASLYPTPSGDKDYKDFTGQLYTGPWDTEQGLNFEWNPSTQAGGDQIVLSVRFLNPVDLTDSGYKTRQKVSPKPAADDPSPPAAWARPAQVCEDENVEFNFDAARYTNLDGTVKAGLQGDPMSKMVTVTCLLEDNGSFTLTKQHMAAALEHVDLMPGGAGGAVFYFSRGTQTEADNIPAAKDLYGQRHEVSPLQITTRSVRVGRFNWTQPSPTEVSNEQ